MSARLFLPFPGNEAMAHALAGKTGGVAGQFELHAFPDGESYVRLRSDVAGLDVAIVCTLDRPDPKFLPLVFAADAARELRARSVGLVAPYLGYMRQDRRFQSGEAVTSRSFARLVSASFDWLVTVDPHLHRLGKLAELYAIPAKAMHAAPLLADWVKQNVPTPVLVGPDAESRQWVSEAAARIGAPFTVLNKEREGDRMVRVALTETAVLAARTPVLMDDIVSSGETMREAVRAVRAVASSSPVCIAVHAIFAAGASDILSGEAVKIVTTNTVVHPTNAIDVSGLLAEGIAGTPIRTD